LLQTVPAGEPLHVISEDGDFYSTLNEDAAHPFLEEEWKARKSSSLHVYRRLSSFMKEHFDGVAFPFDRTKEALIDDLSTSGGGWAAQAGHMHGAREFALLIYLRCLPGTAARRAEQGEARPLLMGGDPVERMRKLLDSREPFYLLADFEVAAERGMAEVAAGVMDLARKHGGW
jgi:hypothetical protein